MLHEVHSDNLKLTKNQSLVLRVLQSSDQPLSAYTILDRLRSDGLKAPLQVSRFRQIIRLVASTGWKA